MPIDERETGVPAETYKSLEADATDEVVSLRDLGVTIADDSRIESLPDIGF
jgi:hypothetical protein